MSYLYVLWYNYLTFLELRISRTLKARGKPAYFYWRLSKDILKIRHGLNAQGDYFLVSQSRFVATDINTMPSILVSLGLAEQRPQAVFSVAFEQGWLFSELPYKYI